MEPVQLYLGLRENEVVFFDQDGKQMKNYAQVKAEWATAGARAEAAGARAEAAEARAEAAEARVRELEAQLRRAQEGERGTGDS